MASFMPAGYEDDSDDDGFAFGDEDYSKYNCAPVKFDNGSFQPQPVTRPPSSSSRPGTGFGSRKSTVSVEDFRMAVIQGNGKLVSEIIEKGMDVNTVFSTGWTALMYAGSGARGEVFKLLIERGANANYHKDLFTVLMATCSANSQKVDVLTECVQLLLDKGADVNARDRHHVTALMNAATEGRTEIAEILLDNGAEIDRQDSRGWTALSWATQRQKISMVKLLLERGADPKKKHVDSLTAIDLARGREEIVWLFEGKSGAAGREVGAGDADATSSIAAAAATASSAKPDQNKGGTDLKYGELEVFLYGLQLGQFYNLFISHQVDFPLLLTMTEQDLTNMGICQVGVRLKLMEGIAAVHKRNWETSSLVPIRIKSQVKCADSIAIVANLSKHLRYISSSVTYIKDHVARNPQFLAISQEAADPKQLLLHTGDAIKHVEQLQKELSLLHSNLAKVLNSGNYSPPDRILSTAGKKNRRVRVGRLLLLGASVSSVVLLVWRRDYVLDNVTSLVNTVRLRLA